MATKTTHLGLSKAELTDAVRSTLIANNGNFDKIDEAYAEVDNKINEAIEKSSLYTLPEEGESQTIQTLYGDYVLTKKQAGAKTTYASTPISENVNVPGIKSGNVSYSTSLENTAFNMTLNGVTNTIAFGSGEGIFSSANKSNIAPAFQDKIDNAFGANQIVVTVAAKLSNYTISFASASENGHMPLFVSSIDSETSSGYGDTLVLLGIESGTSNILDVTQTVATFLGTTETNFSYTINSTTVTLPTSITIEAFFNSVNNCGEDVTIYYDIIGDKIVLEKNYYGKLILSISDTIELFTALGISDTGYTLGSDLIVTMTDPYGKETEQKLLRDSFTTEDVLALVNVQMNQQKTELQGQIDRLRANQVQGSASGTEVVVQDAAEMESVLQLSGNSEQDSRSGKNIYDENNASNVTVSGDDLIYGSNGTLVIDGVFKENTQYTFQAQTKQSASDVYVRLHIYYTDGTSDDALLNSSTEYAYKTFTSDANKTIKEVKTYGGSNLHIKRGTFQIEEGTEATNYEPYGVQPSPDYPSEIRSVKSKSDNLFDFADQNLTLNGATVNISSGIININGTPSAFANVYLGQVFNVPQNGKYTFSIETINYVDSTSDNATCILRESVDGNEPWTIVKELSCRTTAEHKSTITLDLTKFYSFRLYVGMNEMGYNNVTIKPMLNKGDKALPYQPYGYVPVEVKVEGKNLLYIPNKETSLNSNAFTCFVKEQSLTINGTSNGGDTIKLIGDENSETPIIKLEANQIYYMKMFYESGDTNNWSSNIQLRTPSSNIVNGTMNQWKNGFTYIPTENIDITWVRMYLGAYTFTNLKFKLQVSRVNLNEWVEPKPLKTLSLPLGDIELRSTPDGTRDTFEKVDGVWNKVGKARGFNIPNDNTNWNSDTISEYGIIGFSNRQLYTESPSKSYSLYCNNFITSNDYIAANRFEVCFSGGTKYPYHLYIGISADRLDSATYDLTTVTGRRQALNKWLADNPTEIVYTLATPTYTPITDQALISTLDELEQLILHKGYNYITATSVNGVKAQLDLSYIKDINTVLDNLTAAILTLGGELNV